MESNIGAQGQLRRSGVAVAVTAFPTTVALFSIVMYVCFFSLSIGCWVQQWGMVLMLFVCGIIMH